jgi:hypothetical protein
VLTAPVAALQGAGDGLPWPRYSGDGKVETREVRTGLSDRLRCRCSTACTKAITC